MQPLFQGLFSSERTVPRFIFFREDQSLPISMSAEAADDDMGESRKIVVARSQIWISLANLIRHWQLKLQSNGLPNIQIVREGRQFTKVVREMFF